MRSTTRVVGIAVELLVLWLTTALALLVLDAVFGGVTLDTVTVSGRATNLPAALALALVFGLLNAILWPLVVRAMSWIGPIVLFLSVFVAGGLLLMLSLLLVPVATVDRTFDLFVMAALLSLFTSAVGGVIASRSDTSYRLMQVRRQRFRRRRTPSADAGPGLLCLQIDGLGHGVLRRAIADGVTPTIAKLVRETHRLTPWHTDWSSQTGASQLGILHGSNHNVPAFRWYDKTTGTIAVFSNPRDNEQREAERADRPGLLAFDGASRGNLFTGGADDNVLVVSRMRGARLGGGAGYASYFFDLSSALRTVARMIAEIQRELRQALHQRRRDIRPRVSRGGVYPFVRAFTTVVATDITVAAVVRDLINGRSIIYADLIGYDEVSHHSGISRPETLAVLTKIDETIRLLLATVEQADRDYHVVLLSDHGQSQGATFSRRYGETLGQVVDRLCGDPDRPPAEDLSAQSDTEGRLYASASIGSAADTDEIVPPSDRPVVLGSGNLGLISFPHIAGRADTTAIDEAYPGLLDGLRSHPGIGFLLVSQPDGGSVVLGANGTVDVATGSVTGTDPLAHFGDDALEKIRRTDTFDNVADIMVGGAYWPETDEVAAFEEQVGSHGGMGGPQSTPFLLFPVVLPHPPQPLFGAESVHRVLADWRDLRADEVPVASP
ncbi:alkaline phosphatase family protein [Gordonia sp. LSe1-13]|uniref:Alkaline phosphatase family protein n=1 Tax=Gordonia sesuvii TaxID=3116777 RepID=A0ABU7MIY6_9ACTN|nr:alkaline phosphatase family protein [Gordonia sp. LSe1-13]